MPGLLWHPWKGVRTGVSTRVGINTENEPGLLELFPGLALTSAGEIGRKQGPRPDGGRGASRLVDLPVP